MNSDEKIEHVKNIILEKAKISPRGFISISINSFTTEELVELNGGVPDGAPYAMTKMDHINILKKFEQEGLIAFLSFDEQYKFATFAVGSELLNDKKQDQQTKGVNKINNNSLWITKNDDGNYIFEGNPVYIKSKDAQYAIIFDVAYSIKPNGGKIEYKKIIDLCKKRGKNITPKSILKALTGKNALVFHYIKEFKQEPSFGKALFVAMQDGKEIEFNNKK
jgi:hypothetical protein